MSEEFKTLETPYGIFKYPVCEGDEVHLKDIVDYAIAMMEKNGEQERLRIQKEGEEKRLQIEKEGERERLRIEKEGEEKRKNRQQMWDNAKVLAPVVIDKALKSAVSAAAEYYREKQEHEAEKEKQEMYDQLDLGNDSNK